MNDLYTAHLEWEAIDFPIIIKKLKIEDPSFQMEDDAQLEIWRQDNLQLKANIKGTLKKVQTNFSENYIGKGNIAVQQIIKGIDGNGNGITLTGCVFGGYSVKYGIDGNFREPTSVDVIFDKVEIDYNVLETPSSLETQYEWFLCNNIVPRFYGTTVRRPADGIFKARLGIDEFDEKNTGMFGSASSGDYIPINIPQIDFIVAQVPKFFVPNGLAGLCFEFRGENISKAKGDLFEDIKHFFSFILGTKFYYMGNVTISDGKPVRALLDGPKIPLSLNPSIPPIHFNFEYEWGNINLQSNRLLEKYLHLQSTLSLNHAVERRWIAAEIPVGVNLPILAGALEIVADKFLKMKGKNDLVYLPKSEYEILISEGIKSIEQKFGLLPGAEIILNKIRGAFRKGSNEKINLFLSELGIELSEPEKRAINLRNKMTHGNRNYKDEYLAHDDLILTRVYEVLSNRILLKILDFDGYYQDFSIKGSPSRPITTGSGEPT